MPFVTKDKMSLKSFIANFLSESCCCDVYDIPLQDLANSVNSVVFHTNTGNEFTVEILFILCKNHFNFTFSLDLH